MNILRSPSIAEGLADWEDYRPRRPLADRIAAFEAANAMNPHRNALAERVFRVSEDAVLDYDILGAIQRQVARKAAKRQATAIGLVYWPALLSRTGVDPAAFVAAERALTPLHGEWNPPQSHGGWDSMGHYGISPEMVARMWLAAGCRDTKKFRAQVRARVLARKGDSLPFFRAFVRGRRWLAAWGLADYGLARKAIAALGRLSPELRHAAMRGIQPGAEYAGQDGDRILRTPPVRVRDLNWAEVARIQALRADPSHRALAIRALALPNRPAWVVYGQPAKKNCAHPAQDRDVPTVLPAFPLVSIATARRLIAGESPQQISGGVLTRKEAHQWALEGARSDPLEWLVITLDLSGFIPREVEIARWLLAVERRGAWSALTAVVRHPDGRQMRRLDVIDELQPVDLDRGERTGVERAFENAGRRLASLSEGDQRVISRWPAGWPKLPRCASLLTTPSALVAEGRVMDHCVGGYAASAERGNCWIVSLVSRHGRSTVEIRRDGSIAQHQGARNNAPPPRHAALMRAWQNRAARR